MGEMDLSKRFDADGWYSVIAIVAGFVAGLALTWWRSRDFRLTTIALVVGAALAAAVMAVVGRLLGPGDTSTALAAAARGQMVTVPLKGTAESGYLVWPIAVLAGALMVLWSSPRHDEGAMTAPGPDDDLTAPAGNAEHNPR